MRRRSRRGFRERAQAVLETEFADSLLFVLKDPRICRLLPFWIEAVRAHGAIPLVVSPIRNPLDVALSLERRDGIELSIGHLIWLRHVLDAEIASRSLGRAYMRYETLLSNPNAVVKTLGDTLGISWPKHALSDSRIEIDKFLSPSLRHHQTGDTRLLATPGLARWVVPIFEIFDRWSRGELREHDTAKLDRIRWPSTLRRPPLIARSGRANEPCGSGMRRLRNATVGSRSWAGRLRNATVGSRSWAGRLRNATVGSRSWAGRLRNATVGSRSWAGRLRNATVGSRSWAGRLRNATVGSRSWPGG